MKGHQYHERRWIVLNDDVWASQLRDYVRTESVQKGQKNMTVKKFRTFVNDVIIPEVIKKGDEHSKLRGPRNVNGNVSRGTLTASREKRKNLIVRRTLPHSAKHRELAPNGRPG